MITILQQKPSDMGGKRSGAGRPRKEDTIRIRIPKSKEEIVRQFIASLIKNEVST